MARLKRRPSRRTLRFSGARTFRFLEVFPSLSGQFGNHAVLIDQQDTLIPGNLTDLRNGNARNFRRNPLIRMSSEKQFVVIAAVEGELQFHRVGSLPHAGAGNGRGLYFSAYATLVADVAQVGRET